MELGLPIGYTFRYVYQAPSEKTATDLEVPSKDVLAKNKEKKTNNKQKHKGQGRRVFPEVRETRKEGISKERKLLKCQI